MITMYNSWELSLQEHQVDIGSINMIYPFVHFLHNSVCFLEGTSNKDVTFSMVWCVHQSDMQKCYAYKRLEVWQQTSPHFKNLCDITVYLCCYPTETSDDVTSSTGNLTGDHKATSKNNLNLPLTVDIRQFVSCTVATPCQHK